MTIGSFIRQRRTEVKITKREIAKAVGRAESTVHSWENDNRSVCASAIPALAKVLGVTPDMLHNLDGISERSYAFKARPMNCASRDNMLCGECAKWEPDGAREGLYSFGCCCATGARTERCDWCSAREGDHGQA